MARIYITDTGDLDVTPAVTLLTSAGHEVTSLGLDPTDPASTALLTTTAADAEALLVSFVTVDSDVLDALPDLKVIATTTMGADQIDTAAATRGITVCTLPALAAEEVATHALAGTLSLLRRLPQARKATSTWDFTRMPVPPRISDLTLGVFGMGRIARELVTLARPLFGRIVGLDPYVPADAWPLGVERVTDLDTLLRCSHVLSLHVPLTPETSGIIDDRALSLMPRGSHLVNVSRGGIIDEPALLTTLDSRHLAGAFLDVLATEPPPPENPLLHRDDVLVTPHSAFYSSTSAQTYVTTPAQAIIDHFLEDTL